MKSTDLAKAMAYAGGFVSGDKVKDLSDELAKGALKDMPYLYRNRKGQHQYVSLASYLGDFVEAVLHVYQMPFNSRQKPPQTALHAGLYRDVAALGEAAEKVYDLPTKKA